jgi:hypothetical protein
MHHVKRHLPVTGYYLLLTAISVIIYSYLSRLPEASGILTASRLWQIRQNPVDGLRLVWFIFAWGFGLQSLVQIVRVFKRRPRDANFHQLFKHGIYISAHAGFFEELIFRLYAFLSFIILLVFLDDHSSHLIKTAATRALLPAANFFTFGFFHNQFTGTDWALGVAVILGSLFFRSAHVHYGRFSKANVWVIGLVMFWLVFNYGLLTAILAHILYDLAVFTAIALTAPLQPKSDLEAG